MKILFLILCLGLPQIVYADVWDDAMAAYAKNDHVTALQGFKKLAIQGGARAQFQVSLMYVMEQGTGGAPPETGFEWIRKAAEQGHFQAQFWLGTYLPDRNEAFKWLRMAAEQGGPHAQSSLGYAYENGEGVEQNYIQAYVWYKLSAWRGNKYVLDDLEKLSEHMAPDQIAEAQALAKEWAGKYNK